jgi:DNA-binding CsgD family transcriptional regulator
MAVKMTHEQRRKRRQEIAAYAAEGRTAAETAEHFGVTSQTVYNACRPVGVVPAATKQTRHVAYATIADLINTDDTHAVIAARRGTTRQRVGQIASKCREAGIPIRRRQGETDG